MNLSESHNPRKNFLFKVALKKYSGNIGRIIL